MNTNSREFDVPIGVLLILLSMQIYIPYKLPIVGWHVSLSQIGTILLFAYVILQVIKERRLPQSKLILPLTAFSLTMVISLSVALSKGLAIQYIILWSLFCMTYMVTLYGVKSEAKVLGALGILSLLMGALAIYQYFIGPEGVMNMVQGWFGRYLMHPGTVRERLDINSYGWVWLGNVKVFGTFVNVNTFAAFLNLLFPIALSQALSSRGIKGLYWSLISIILGISIWFTISRGGILTMLIIGAALVLYYRREILRFLLLGLVCAALIIILSGIKAEKIQGIIAKPSLERLSSSFSISENLDRLYLWEMAIDIIKNNFFLGVGVANYGLYAQEHYEGKYVLAPAHNNFLQIFAEQGVLGLVTFLWLLLEAIKIMILFLETPGKERASQGLAIGLLGSLASFILMGIINVTYLDVQYGAFFLALLGIMDALYSKTESIKTPAQEWVTKG